MSQVEDMTVIQVLTNGEELTSARNNVQTDQTENEDKGHMNGAISNSAAAEAAMLAGIDVDAKPAPETPKKIPRRRGAAAGGPTTPTTPKGRKKRSAGSDNPDGVTPPKKTKTTDPKTSDAADPAINGADTGTETSEQKTPKPAKTPKAPKTPKTPKNTKATNDGADGEPKSSGRKRASPNGGEKPAAALSIPLSWDTAEEHDRKLVDMKKDGATWGEINKMWKTVTGRVAKGSTLPNRYIRLMANFAQLKPGEDEKLVAAVAQYEREKWQLIAGFMDTVDEKKYAATFLQKEYKKIEDAKSNRTYVPTTVVVPAAATEDATDDKDEEVNHEEDVVDDGNGDIKSEGSEGTDVE
ncbi:hypothetical protein MMC30_002969 [Trapelia coarctata]|nr:hypothetical protein [Trapelia coarctata]